MLLSIEVKEVAEKLAAAVDRGAILAYHAGQLTPEYAMMAWAEKAAYTRVVSTVEKLERAADSERKALLTTLTGENHGKE